MHLQCQYFTLYALYIISFVRRSRTSIDLLHQMQAMINHYMVSSGSRGMNVVIRNYC